MEREALGYEFQFVVEIQPERDEKGRLKQFVPQQSYQKANEKPVHR